MADAKVEAKKDNSKDAGKAAPATAGGGESGGGFEVGAFLKFLAWIFLIIIVIISSYFIVIVNPQTAVNFIYFINALQIFFSFYLIFIIYKLINHTYTFKYWSDKIGEFYSKGYKPDKKDITATVSPLRNRLEKATQHINSKYKEEWKIGVIELDNILRDLLKGKNYLGDTVGDLLQDAGKKDMKTVNIAWDAHKIRNKVVHEGVKYDFPKETAELTLRKYSEVFTELGI